jgi:hypothetical protein
MSDGERDDADRAAATSSGSGASEREGAADEVTHTPDDAPWEGEGEGGALDDIDVRDLLRGALRPPPGAIAPELLGGVQRKIRQRSRGKFYGDGWSTAQAPRSTYLVTSVIMLVLIVVIAVLLVPWEAVGL